MMTIGATSRPERIGSLKKKRRVTGVFFGSFRQDAGQAFSPDE